VTSDSASWKGKARQRTAVFNESAAMPPAMDTLRDTSRNALAAGRAKNRLSHNRIVTRRR
jgi:hypothetical protein